MLNWLPEKCREYLAHAATARALAETAKDAQARKDFFEIERRCLDRAQSYQLAEWLAWSGCVGKADRGVRKNSGSSTMDKFIARENIRHFRDRLETETDPSIRSRLHRLLVEEEDKLGHNSEALDTIDKHIANTRARVNRQEVLLGSLERDGHDTAHALTLLGALNETLLLFENRRQTILIALDQSSP